MRLIILVSPGAGKGTQSEKLSQSQGNEIISTGDMLRKAISSQTD